MSESLEVVQGISDITRAEIDIQISTAKKYPRSLAAFRQDALSMATSDKEVAASCFYKLKRKGEDGPQFIEGPSVRLAEIVANAWGNLRYGARIIAENKDEVIAQGVAHDLEKNVFSTIEVSRRITRKDGTRFGHDMIQVTKNAACSIALRNAIFKTVPFTYAKAIYEKAKQTAVGTAKTLGERRQEMLSQFSKMSVTKEQVVKFLEVPSIEDIGLAEVETMIGVHTAIKNGDTTVDEQFKPDKPPADEMPKARSGKPPEGQAAVEPKQTAAVSEQAAPVSTQEMADEPAISEAHAKNINKILDTHKLREVFLKHIKEVYGIEKVEDIKASWLSDIMARINALNKEAKATK